MSEVLVNVIGNRWVNINGQNTFHAMTDCIGSNDQPGGMALVFGDLNLKKKNFFSFNTPALLNDRVRSTKIMHRDVSSLST